MSNELKLVVWDLDNTLWRGTLAEGDAVDLFPKRAEIIKALTDIGVVNSICSKNNFDDAKHVLIDMGLWEYFVFPKISFAPKGTTVQALLDEMHLRAANTVFIDDEPANLREVQHYNPDITVLPADECENFFGAIPVTAKVDKTHPRLNQYKQLERKSQRRRSFASNEDFLRASNIRIEFVPVTTKELFDRLCELTERTNQLNFTKNRMTRAELFEVVHDPDVDTRLVRATDNFGDYGYIGFYSKYMYRLIHFVFSCRVINMGIEQFVWQHLGFPQIALVGDTATKLNRNVLVDYISIITKDDKNKFPEESIEKILTPDSQVNIFALGACDLFHAIGLFALPNNNFFYECNVFVGNERGVNVGTEYIRSSLDMTDDEKNFCRRHFHNYTRHNVFKSEIFNAAWDYVILSFHDDMVFKIYEHKRDPNLRVILSPAKVFGSTSVINITEGRAATDDEQRAWLAENFSEGHFIAPERFAENLIWIAAKLPAKTRVILVKAPTIDFFRENLPHCPEVREQIFKLNAAIDLLCKVRPDKFAAVSMDKVVRSLDDITNYIFHLKAQTAFRLFVNIAEAMQKFLPLTKPPMLHKVLNGRKVVVFGKNFLEFVTACCDLFLGNEKISAIVNPQADNMLDFKRDENFIVVADNDNYAEIRQLLIDNGYEPTKDFVQFRPKAYKKVWQD